MTDERMGDVLGAAIARAAEAGAGVIVRHHHSPVAIRRALASEVLASGAVLGLSRDPLLAVDLGADFVHNPVGESGALPFSLSVHDDAQAREAARRSPAFVFVSPLYATRSHPDAEPLGEAKAAQLATLAGCPAYALGGVTQSRGEELIARGWAGWAAIDAWA